MFASLYSLSLQKPFQPFTRTAIKLTVWLSLYLYAPLAIAATESPPLRIGINVSSAPWTPNDPAQLEGIANEIIEHTFAEMGTPIRLSIQPAARLLAQLRNNKLDGALVLDNASTTPPDSLVCTPPLLTLPFGLYLPQHHQDPTGNKNQGKLKLGMMRLSHMDLRQMPDHYEFEAFNNADMMFRAFKAGRVDGVIASPVITAFWRDALQLDLQAQLHFGHLQTAMCFSTSTLGNKAESLAKGFYRFYLAAIDQSLESLSPSTLQAITTFDARLRAKTLLEVE